VGEKKDKRWMMKGEVLFCLTFSFINRLSKIRSYGSAVEVEEKSPALEGGKEERRRNRQQKKESK
jgi:hypothetical protein